MDQQEIEKIIAECKKITDEFRASLSPAMVENNIPNTLQKIDSRGNQTNEYVQLFAANSKQVFEYIEEIQKICNHEVIDSIKNLGFLGTIIDCSYLAIKGDLLLQGELPNSNFDRAIFYDTAYFSRVVFSQNVSFRGVIFTSMTLFSLTIFSKKVDFRHTIFSHYVSFTQANFTDFADFRDTTFSQRSDFKKAIFMGGVGFSKAKFSNQVGFNNVIFTGGVDFSDVIFLSMFTDFNAVKFMGNVAFRNVKFTGYVDFGGTLFNGEAFFHNIEFYNSVNFAAVLFLMNVEFTSSKFLKIAHFKDVKFSNEANFNNTKFKDTTNFSDCLFNAAPLLHNTKLHQDTSFEGTQFLRCSEEEDYRAYRTLKQHMNNVHAKLEENMFFALEQRTRRYLDAQDMRKNWFTVTISWFYDMISGYGQDLLRPIMWLAGISVLFAIIFSNANVEMVILNSKDFAWTNTVYQGWGYSFQNLNPLNMLSKDLPFKPTTFFVLILGYIESLLSVAFITLWLLAVRRRFQKGE